MTKRTKKRADDVDVTEYNIANAMEAKSAIDGPVADPFTSDSAHAVIDPPSSRPRYQRLVETYGSPSEQGFLREDANFAPAAKSPGQPIKRLAKTEVLLSARIEPSVVGDSIGRDCVRQRSEWLMGYAATSEGKKKIEKHFTRKTTKMDLTRVNLVKVPKGAINETREVTMLAPPNSTPHLPLVAILDVSHDMLSPVKVEDFLVDALAPEASTNEIKKETVGSIVKGD